MSLIQSLYRDTLIDSRQSRPTPGDSDEVKTTPMVTETGSRGQRKVRDKDKRWAAKNRYSAQIVGASYNLFHPCTLRSYAYPVHACLKAVSLARIKVLKSVLTQHELIITMISTWTEPQYHSVFMVSQFLSPLFWGSEGRKLYDQRVFGFTVH